MKSAKHSEISLIRTYFHLKTQVCLRTIKILAASNIHIPNFVCGAHQMTCHLCVPNWKKLISGKIIKIYALSEFFLDKLRKFIDNRFRFLKLSTTSVTQCHIDNVLVQSACMTYIYGICARKIHLILRCKGQ